MLLKNSSVTLAELNSMEALNRVPVTIFIGVLSLIGICGNVTVLIVFCRSNKRKTTFDVFVISLAVIDTIGCSVAFPFEIVDMALPYTFHYPLICKAFRFLGTVLIMLSILNILIIAVERYKRVCRPLKPQMSVGGAKKLCLGALLVAFAVSWPAAVFNGRRTIHLPNNITGMDCSTDDHYNGSTFYAVFSGFNIILFIGSSLTFIIMYSAIIRTIHIQSKRRAALMNGGTRTNNNKQLSQPTCNKAIGESNKSVNHTRMVGEPYQNSLKKEEIECHGTYPIITELITLSMSDTDKANTDCSSLDTIEGTRNGIIKSSRSCSINTNGTESTSLDTANDETMRTDATISLPTISCPKSVVRDVKPKRSNNKVTRILCLITGVFIMSYLPYVILVMVMSYNKTFKDQLSVTGSVLVKIAMRLNFLNYVLNPIVYCFCDDRFRNDVIQFYRNVCT